MKASVNSVENYHLPNMSSILVKSETTLDFAIQFQMQRI